MAPMVYRSEHYYYYTSFYMSEKEKENIKKEKEEQLRKRKSEVVEMGKSLRRGEQEWVKLLCRNKKRQEWSRKLKSLL